MKTIAASVAVLAALGLVTINYQSSEGSQLFLTERITEQEESFLQWIVKFDKSYPTISEYKLRLDQFKQNLIKIESHNNDDSHGSKVGLNAFSDFTEDEYKRLLGYKPEMMQGMKTDIVTFNTENLADEIDWRGQGAVSPVKNQG